MSSIIGNLDMIKQWAVLEAVLYSRNLFWTFEVLDYYRRHLRFPLVERNYITTYSFLLNFFFLYPTIFLELFKFSRWLIAAPHSWDRRSMTNDRYWFQSTISFIRFGVYEIVCSDWVYVNSPVYKNVWVFFSNLLNYFRWT